MNDIIPLVYFSHAELKRKDALVTRLELIKSSSKRASKRGHLTQTSTSSPSKRLKLNIEDDDMNYEAFEEDECPFMVGIVPKRGGDEITVLNTAYFVMRPECYSSSDVVNQELGVEVDASYSDKLNSLTAAFGSSRKRKAMQTKLKNKIDAETLEV